MLDAEKGVYGLLQQADFEPQIRPSNESVSVAPNPQHYTPIRSQPEESVHPGKSLQKEIRNVIDQNRHIALSEDALQLIDEIEKRSLA